MAETTHAGTGPVLTEGLGPGVWLALDYGFERRVFYVVRASATGAWIASPRWLVSSATFVPRSRLDGAERLGRGAARWWWRFVPWRELIVPFRKPRGLFWA